MPLLSAQGRLDAVRSDVEDVDEHVGVNPDDLADSDHIIGKKLPES